MATASDMVACARGLLGVRFAHQGRGADGLDCLGLLIYVAGAMGLDFDGVPALALDVPVYGHRPDVAGLKKKLDAYLVAVALAEVRVGDVLLLKIDGSPQHLALVADYPAVGELAMIHAYAPSRQVVEHRYDAQWRRDTYAVYRLPQLV